MKRAIYPILFVLPIIMLGIIAGLFGYRVNFTQSMPVGLWQIMKIGALQKGDVALFCLPLENEAYTMALARGYFSPGTCPGHINPLLKSIVATAGDVVNTTTDFTEINGRKIKAYIRSYDSYGLPLPQLNLGTYILPEGEVWVLADSHQNSFDSRYFGAIHTSQIIGTVKPVLIWQ